MHVLKHLIGWVTSPLMIAGFMVAIAAAYGLTRRRTVAYALLVGAVALAYLSTTTLVGDALLGPLEQQYPPLAEDRPLPPVDYIVVLGSDYVPRNAIPVTAALDADGLARIVEGIRLSRKAAAAKLIVSGGAPQGGAAPAAGYARLARDLGVPEASIIVSDQSLDTHEESNAVSLLVGTRPFILVTSASHMPRAMRLMERAGVHPIPAPTAQRAGRRRSLWASLIPGSGGLRETEYAIHEYAGIVAIKSGVD